MNEWNEAYDRLSPSLKKHLTRARQEKADVLAALLEQAELKKTICLQKRWKIKLAGKTIVLRDIFDKIIVWVHKFSAIGDTAVQFDPTPASLAWAGVRFLLQVCISDNICFESTTKGLEVASRMITRYSAFQSLYMQVKSGIQAELKSRLISLYTLILQFLGNAVEYFSQSAATRLVKSAFQLSQNNELEMIAELDTEVEKLARVSDAQVQLQISDNVQQTQTILNSMQEPLRRIVDTSIIYKRTTEEQQFRELLMWMSSVPYSQHHATHSEPRITGSTKWLTKHPRFVDWNESSTSSILLLHGIPGCGKTCLTASVVDTFLDAKAKNPLTAPLAYFYCGDSRIGRGRADPEEIMGCLTRQMAVINREKQEVHENVLLEYQRKAAEAKLDGFDVPRLKIPQCVDLIGGILSSNPATLVVDGIDEVEENRRHELLDALMQIRDNSASVVKIFVSSREDRDILTHLSDAVMLRVEEEDTRRDMELFVESKLSSVISTHRLLGGDVPQEVHEEITAFLLELSGGMFLWVILQLDHFCRLKSKASVLDAMRTSLKATNESLTGMYTEMLDRLHGDDPIACELAKRAFSWLLCMQEPLTPEALLLAISSSSPEEQQTLKLSDLLHVCLNLIFVDSKLNTLRFIHLSFKEYLEGNSEFSESCVNMIAAHGCLNTCIQDTPSDLANDICPKERFEVYANLFWGKHYQAAVTGNKRSLILPKLKEFVSYDDGDTSLSFLAWLDTAQTISELLPPQHPSKTELSALTSTSMTPIFTACVYGIVEVVEDVVTKTNFDTNETSEIGYTPLYLAAAFGHDGIIRMLLSHDANPAVNGGKHGRPVNAACANGHIVATQLLLNHDPSSMTSTDWESLLQLSLVSRREDISLLLLQNYIKIKDRESYIGAVEKASQAGAFEVVQWLTKSHTEFSTVNTHSKLLNLAIMKGQLSFLKKLSLKVGLPHDCVANAASFGHTEVISFCLDEGASLEQEGPLGSPLRAASLMGHEIVVRLLIARGADISASGKFGDALQAAAMNGHRSITDFLIQNKADVNAQGGYYGNPLQAAASRGHCEVVEALLNAGARMSDQGRFKNAFFAAAEAGHHAVVGLFIGKGFQFPLRRHIRYSKSSFRNLLGWALSDAEYGRHREPKQTICSPVPDAGFENSLRTLRKSLSSDPSDLDWVSEAQDTISPTTHENNPLVTAASQGWALAVHHMVADREKLRIHQDDIETALQEAASHGHTEIVNVLLRFDIERTWKVSNALTAAAQSGNIPILEILIRHNDDSGSLGRNDALLIAKYGSRGGQFSSFQYCLPKMSNHDIPTIVASAIKETAKFNHIGMMKVLLQKSGYVNGEVVRQAFRAAALKGSTDVVRYLISTIYAKYLERENYLEAFRAASFYGHAALAELLLDCTPSPCTPEYLRLLFINAAFEGHRGVLKLLLPEIRKLDCYQSLLDISLCFSCAEGEVDAASFLVDAGSSVNALVDNTIGIDEDPALVDLPLEDDSDEYRVGSKRGLPRSSYRWSRESRRSAYWKSKGQWSALQACLKSPRYFKFSGINGIPGKVRPLASKHMAVLQLLISQNADVNMPGGDGHTPLHWAAYREIQCLPFVSSLLNAGAQCSIDGSVTESNDLLMEKVLHFFERNGRFQDSESIEEVFTTGPGAVLKLLLESNSDLLATDCRFSLVLEMVATIGDTNYTRLLIDRRVDVNSPGHSFGHALISAARFGHPECLKMLLNAGADVNVSDISKGTALQSATMCGHTEVVRILIGHGIDLNSYRDTDFAPDDFITSPALNIAINRGHFYIASLLVNAGADVNILPLFGSPPIIEACAHGDVKLLKLFFERGANVNIDERKLKLSGKKGPVRDEEASALHKACAEGRADLIPLLLAEHADIEKRIGETLTPLEVAAKSGQLEVLKQLLDVGATVYDPSRGINAFKAACRGNDPIPSILLLRQGMMEQSEDLTSAFHESAPTALKEGHGDVLVFLMGEKRATTYVCHQIRAGSA